MVCHYYVINPVVNSNPMVIQNVASLMTEAGYSTFSCSYFSLSMKILVSSFIRFLSVILSLRIRVLTLIIGIDIRATGSTTNFLSVGG